jgi:hypothetical protein
VLGLAALVLAAATANPSTALTTASPWWEKFTFTMSNDGAQQSCQFESSNPAVATSSCEEDEAASPGEEQSSVVAGPYTKITIERRFTPASQPDPVILETGDTLLGSQVLSLAIDRAGAVSNCAIVGKSGEVNPPYGCDEARTERFEASADRAPAQVRHGFMTVLVYGHEEYPA